MIRGIYTSSASMLCETIRQDMVANNLANVDTPGYKRKEGIFKELPTTELRKVNDGQLYPPRPLQKFPKIGRLGTGVILDETFTDFDQGKFENTDNPLDLALDNKNEFFVVETDRGPRFTRDGVFMLNSEGYLVNGNGEFVMAEPVPNEKPVARVLNEDGEYAGNFVRVKTNLPSDRITVDTEGRVVINDQPRFRLLRGAMADRTAFQSEGSNLFKWDHGVVDLERSGKVKIGFVEKPNFSVVQEMVKMIEVARAYEANAKCVQTHDSLLDRCINSVGPTRR